MHIKYFFVSVVMMGAVAAMAQTQKELVPSGAGAGNVYSYVEVMPKADYDYNDYLVKHIKYPAKARKNDIEGRVIVKFIVNEDGTFSDCKVVRSTGDVSMDDEALRVVRASPKWKPGMQNGKPVKVYFTMPIVFRLDYDDAKKSK